MSSSSSPPSGAHPYEGLPDRSFWRRAVANVAPESVDPCSEVPYRITPKEKIVTAGSCFAQHVARYLKRAGYDYLVTERAHPIATLDLAAEYNYGTFSARYGNLYTSRQLIQLVDRAYGRFQPADDRWEAKGGAFIDPFRPRIQPGGFATRAEYDADRAAHFAAVRRALESLDVFIFTLGLTEHWYDRRDGAVYPLAPGVAGGRFDPAHHAFGNLSVTEVVEDLFGFLGRLKQVNDRARVILTVSPVPLIATAEPRHVLSSTVYSKSVLRVASDIVERAHDNVVYFPSYEIIAGPAARGRYFGPDARAVTERGVAHVMRVFFERFTDSVPDFAAPPTRPEEGRGPDGDERRLQAELEEAAEAVCDEEALDPGAG